MLQKLKITVGLLVVVFASFIALSPAALAADLGNECKSADGCLKKTDIVGDVQTIVNALAAGVGVVVVGTIIVGGIQYIQAGDNPGGVQEAKKRIANGIFALVAFFLTYAFLSWLIPGGIFG